MGVGTISIGVGIGDRYKVLIGSLGTDRNIVMLYIVMYN